MGRCFPEPGMAVTRRKWEWTLVIKEILSSQEWNVNVLPRILGKQILQWGSVSTSVLQLLFWHFQSVCSLPNSRCRQQLEDGMCNTNSPFRVWLFNCLSLFLDNTLIPWSCWDDGEGHNGLTVRQKSSFIKTALYPWPYSLNFDQTKITKTKANKRITLAKT